MALIDIASSQCCTLSELLEKFSALELKLWLVRYMIKMGFTYDKEKIRNARVDAFMKKARESWQTSNRK